MENHNLPATLPDSFLVGVAGKHVMSVFISLNTCSELQLWLQVAQPTGAAFHANSKYEKNG